MKATTIRNANVSKLGESNFKGQVISGNETVRISAAELFSPENADFLNALARDTRRGASIYFKENEEIYFFPWDQQVFEVEGWETVGKEIRLLLRCAAYCERYKEFFFPLTIVRSIPVDEDLELPSGEVVNSREYQLRDNVLGEKLLPVMSDIDRVKLLAGKVVKVTEKVAMHQRSRKDPDTLVPKTIYKFNESK